MSTLSLFADGVVEVSDGRPREGQPPVRGAPRVLCADRRQMFLRTCDYDSLLPTDHLARLLWVAVERLDLSKFYDRIESRQGEPGRSAIDPRIVITLLLYARAEGITSAREVERRCETDDAYRWICGGVEVNHHKLADYVSGFSEEVDELFTQVVGLLMHHGLVTLDRVAQDGLRVRASAGAASFRREKSLQKCLEDARAHLNDVHRHTDEAQQARRRAAAERAARERVERLEKALAELPKVREAKKGEKEKADSRVSTTDPEARVMKMADGGFRPAFNAQLATDVDSRVIVGVTLTNAGGDSGQMGPMLEDIERRTGKRPAEYLVDGGFVNLEAIANAARHATTVYAPPPTPRKEGIDPYQPKEGDAPEVAEWRKRMATPEAKEVYKDRAATAESVNADLRVRGMDELLVRGTKKALTSLLWTAITYNLLQLVKHLPLA